MGRALRGVSSRCWRGVNGDRLRLAFRAVSRVNAGDGLTWVRVMKMKRWSATVGRALEPSLCTGSGPGGIDYAVDQIRAICRRWVDERAS